MESTGNNKTRLLYISIMQVFAITLVFIGHATRIFPKWAFFYSPVHSSFMHGINLIIYSFHMALFVFISGFLYANSFIKLDINSFQYIKKRFKRLIIPFYLFGIFWNIPIWKLGNVYPDFSLTQKIKFIFTGMNNGHLWFLAMLFSLTLIFVLIEKLLLKKQILLGLLIFIPAYFLNIHGKNSYYQIFRVNLYIIYFYIGYLSYYYKDIILTFIQKYNLKLLLSLGFIWSILEILLVFNYKNPLKILNLITSIIAIFTVLSLAKLIANKYGNYLIKAKLFNFIAINSFLLYIFHEPIMFVILRLIKYGTGLLPIETFSICFLGSFILSSILVIIYNKIKCLITYRKCERL